jgi:hypothetical protein
LKEFNAFRAFCAILPTTAPGSRRARLKEWQGRLGMQGKGLYWISMILAGASIALVIVNGTMFLSNQSAQLELTQRQQFINQSVALARVNETLVRALASAAANNKDDQLRDLLAQHGITFTVNAPAAAAGGAQGGAAPAAAPKN